MISRDDQIKACARIGERSDFEYIVRLLIIIAALVWILRAVI